MKIGIIGAGAIGYTPARAYCTLHMEELVKALPKNNEASAATHRDEVVHQLVTTQVAFTQGQVIALNSMVYE